MQLVSWLRVHRPVKIDRVFVHGDYNTASVIFDQDEIAGIIDWEFAGEGWREYDLAWALRARKQYLNSQEEREAVLQGYSSISSYDPMVLKWCEILNYLHFAYWLKKSDLQYSNFALKQAFKLVFHGEENQQPK